MIRLSVVATLYQSAPYLMEFHRRTTLVAQQLAGDSYEIVLINDGSPDASREVAIELSEQDSHVVLVDLSRNFGHHKAIMCGLRISRGEQVFLLDSDLEERPEWLLSFSETMHRLQSDVVYGVQERRKGGMVERWSGLCFYRLFNLATGLNLPANLVTARLMTRRYVDALLQHEEREIFFVGLCLITGYSQVPHIVRKESHSETTYTLRRKVSILVNSVTAFSNLPLIFIFYVGIAISIFALSYISYVLCRWTFFGRPLSGWSSIIASIWLLGGMIISFIGIIGIYLSKIFSETKRRPSTIIRQIYAKDLSCTSCSGC